VEIPVRVAENQLSISCMPRNLRPVKNICKNNNSPKSLSSSFDWLKFFFIRDNESLPKKRRKKLLPIAEVALTKS